MLTLNLWGGGGSYTFSGEGQRFFELDFRSMIQIVMCYVCFDVENMRLCQYVI